MAGHCAYQLYAHITWHTWKRVGCIDQAASREVVIGIEHAAARTGIRILRTAVLADHVHVLISLRPSSNLSEFVRLAKSVAAYRTNCRVSGAVRWARGFYAASLHRKDLDRVAAYITNQ